jgi:Cyclic nucleotide-binding domain
MFSLISLLSHVSNALYAIGSSFRNMVYLRVCFIMAAFFDVIYYFFAMEKPLWTPLSWSMAVVAINIYQVLRILYEKRFLNLSADEEKVFDMIGTKMDILNFKKFMRAGHWHEFGQHKEIITENEATERLFLLVDGEAEVRIHEKHVSTIKKGNFIGEMSFLSGELPSANVFTVTPSKILSWEKTKLRQLLEKNTELRHEIHSLFSKDLIMKLINQNKRGIL